MDITAPKTIMIRQRCLHCDGQGYVEIRDCAGEVQREETCLFCGGTGEEEVVCSNRRQATMHRS